MMKERLKRKFKQITRYNLRLKKEKLDIEETVGLMEEKETGRVDISQALPESKVFIADPTNFIDLSPNGQYSPEQSWAAAMIRLSVNDLLKPSNRKKDLLNKKSAEEWFRSEKYYPGSYLFCCDMLKVNSSYFWSQVSALQKRIRRGKERVKRISTVGTRASVGRYFISR